MAATRLFFLYVFIGAAHLDGAVMDPADARGHAETYQAARSKVEALETHIQEMRAEAKRALDAHKATFEAKLQAKRAASTQLALQNTHIAKEARAMLAIDAELYTRAKEYRKDIGRWKDDWEGMKLNIEVALETTAFALRSFNYSAAPETQVLRDLGREEVREEAVEQQASRFDELLQPEAGKRAAFVQTGPATGRKLLPTSTSILQSLEQSVADMSAEHERKEGQLMGRFFKLLQAEDQRHERLLVEQSHLNSTRQAIADRHDQLALATRHLQGLSGQLAGRGQALRSFVGHLGSRPLPPVEESAETAAQAINTSLPEGRFVPLVAPAEKPTVLAEGGTQDASQELRAQVATPTQLRTPSRTDERSGRTPRFAAWWVY